MRVSLFKRFFCLIFLAIFGIFSVASSQDFSKVEIKTVKLTENVYMLVGAGGNIGLSVGEDGVLLIDSQFSQIKEKIKTAITELNQGPVRFLLNTNWHYDHSLGNEAWAQEGAVIITHKNTRERMLSEWTAPELDPDLKIPPFPKAALPVITITESMTMYFNGDKVEVTHFPHAHSDGDLAFYFTKANVIHTGDLYFSGGFPFINITSGGSIDGMIQSADSVIKMINNETKVIPGHGPLSNRAKLQAYRDMLAKAKERIDKLIKSGKTLEETIAAKPTEGLYSGGESSFPADAFIKVVYMELSKQ